MIGDRVMAVNGIDIMNLPHNEIVDLIRDSGLSVRLTIAPSTNFREQYNGIYVFIYMFWLFSSFSTNFLSSAFSFSNAI